MGVGGGEGVIWRKVKILVELKELNGGKIYPILMMGAGWAISGEKKN